MLKLKKPVKSVDYIKEMEKYMERVKEIATSIEPLPADFTTGRDGYLMMNAMVYAVAYIQSLPQNQQEYSDMCDMCNLLRSRWPAYMVASKAVEREHYSKMTINFNPGKD